MEKDEVKSPPSIEEEDDFSSATVESIRFRLALDLQSPYYTFYKKVIREVRKFSLQKEYLFPFGDLFVSSSHPETPTTSRWDLPKPAKSEKRFH